MSLHGCREFTALAVVNSRQGLGGQTLASISRLYRHGSRDVPIFIISKACFFKDIVIYWSGELIVIYCLSPVSSPCHHRRAAVIHSRRCQLLDVLFLNDTRKSNVPLDTAVFIKALLLGRHPFLLDRSFTLALFQALTRLPPWAMLGKAASAER